VSSYLLNIGRQNIALLALGLSTADLADEVVKLLAVEDPLALALHLDHGQLGKYRIAHHASGYTAATSVRWSAGGNSASAERHRLRRCSCLLGQLLRDGEL
jgi:fructose/tagatose bisphosphate aldolase